MDHPDLRTTEAEMMAFEHCVQIDSTSGRSGYDLGH